MPKYAATFGVWYAKDGAIFEFVRWLKEDEAPPSLALPFAAQRFLDGGGQSGAELPISGRYLIQVLNRGQSGAQLQCMTFSAVPEARPLKVRIGP